MMLQCLKSPVKMICNKAHQVVGLVAHNPEHSSRHLLFCNAYDEYSLVSVAKA